MPELSRFEGMVIKMLFNDTVQHNKPHVHVTYGEYKASVGIDGELLAGSLPQKQFKMLVGWLALHEDEAYACLLYTSFPSLSRSIQHFRRQWPAIT